MADSTAIDQALINKLLADATLRALMPDGVFFEEAGASMVTGGHARQYVIVSLVDEEDEPMFGGRAWEDGLYLVKAVELSSSVAVKNIAAAAARIDALLEMGTLTIAGYALMLLRREKRIRYPDPDPEDASIMWQHRGGHYRLMAAPV